VCPCPVAQWKYKWVPDGHVGWGADDAVANVVVRKWVAAPEPGKSERIIARESRGQRSPQ